MSAQPESLTCDDHELNGRTASRAASSRKRAIDDVVQFAKAGPTVEELGIGPDQDTVHDREPGCNRAVNGVVQADIWYVEWVCRHGDTVAKVSQLSSIQLILVRIRADVRCG